MSAGRVNEKRLNGSQGIEGLEAPASAITYPSQIAVKAMGLAVDKNDEVTGFEALIESLVVPLLEPATPERIETRASSGGKYQSVSVHFIATSQGQLEAIYGALHAEPRVLFTL